MISLDDVRVGAKDLIYTIDQASYEVKPENVKRALFNAAFSPNQELQPNGTVALALKPYVTKDLPHKSELYAYLLETNKQAEKGYRANLSCQSYWQAVYHIESLHKRGLLEQFCIEPQTFLEWRTTRDRLYALFHDGTGNYGMSWKTLSFALLLIWPLTCDLVPVDRFVMARFGLDGGSPQEKKAYERVEQLVIDERKEAGFENIPLGQWHWYKWEEYRQLQGKSLADGAVQSHRALCCFD